MAIFHTHNLRTGRTAPSVAENTPAPKPYGVRISLRPDDPFRRLLGADWNRVHWFDTAAQRDAALAELSREHEFSRIGDAPAMVFEKVEILAVPRPR